MNNLLKAIIFSGVALGGIVISTLIVNYFKEPETAQTTRPIVECPPTAEDYKNTLEKSGQVADLIPNPVPSYGENGQFKYKQVVITQIETNKSKVACGYFSIKVHTASGGLKTWENVYINPDNFGGHVSSKNQFGRGDGREYSDYIFALNKIEYWPTRNDRTIRNADWASLLNVSNQVTFEIGLNTTDSTGTIDEASMVYKCWDPKTGKENKDCKIEVSQHTDKIIED